MTNLLVIIVCSLLQKFISIEVLMTPSLVQNGGRNASTELILV